MRFLSMLMTAFLLTACSSDDEQRQTAGKEIADDFNRSMDKAHQVEEQLFEQKRQIDEALQNAEHRIDDDS